MTFKIGEKVLYLGFEYEVKSYSSVNNTYTITSVGRAVYNVAADRLTPVIGIITSAASNAQTYGSSNNNIARFPPVPTVQMQSKFNIGDRILSAWSAERGKITNVIHDGINYIYEVQMDNFTGTERFFEADLILDKKNMELNKITNTAVCKCGSWTTYGKEAPKEAHSFWCDIVTGGKE